MLCEQCGFHLSNQANFCPQCGKKLACIKFLETARQRQAVSTLKVLLGIILIGLIALSLFILFSDNMTESVSGQLKAIKEGRLKGAYDDYTSSSFRQATSFQRFSELMTLYPAFSGNRSVRFIDREMQNDTGSLHALILSEQKIEIPVHYRLIKEAGKWVIQSIRFENRDFAKALKREAGQPKVADPIALRSQFSEQNNAKNGEASLSKPFQDPKKEEVFDSKPLKAVIKSLMDSVRQHNLKRAYQEFTSRDFQKMTSFKEFEEFIHDNPTFSEGYLVDVDHLSFDNNVANLSGLLEGSDGSVHSVEYNLLQEAGVWKILHIQILDLDHSPYAKGTDEEADLLNLN